MSLPEVDLMRRRSNAGLIPYFIFVCLEASLPAAAHGQTYTITDLGDLGGYYSEAHGINSSGNVVGEFEPTNSFYQHAFYYHNGANEDIGGLGSNHIIYAIAYGINDSNSIVGEYSPTDPNVDIQAFVYTNGV